MASIDVTEQLKTDLQKNLFKLKSPNAAGLLINILQSCDKRNVRFTQCDFQSSGNVLALANNDAHIYIIDFLVQKFWKFKQLDSCVYLKLSECNDSQLLVGKNNGVIEVLHIDSGKILGKLLGHQQPVVSISFTQNNICISSTKYEAIIWDLSNYNKLQVLSLEKKCALKFVLFVPISKHILVCYKDDIIQIWQNGSFENLKQFHPSNWRNHSVRAISFSRNGKIMAVSGYLPVLSIFQLDTWKLLKIINLPDYINSVKKVQFVPQNFDGGCNKLLAILSGNGIIYFYNAEDNILISELKTYCEISSFSMPCSNVQYVSCVLCSGEVQVYDIQFYTMKDKGTVIVKAQDVGKRSDCKLKLKNFCRKVDVMAKLQMETILEIDKLKLIIKEYREFPEAFRSTIWERILKLPNNIRQYNSIVNHVGVVAFDELQRQFPLEDKVTIRCLRHVLNNVATWCPFFAQVEFLPYFLFPFVKVFHKKPIACFELCCTIIVNWCQHWFEYHPLPPVNVLAIIDNMLMEHDATALQHFCNFNIKPISYSWSLLESAFSEVLTAPEWLIFWDHVFINEPSFLLCAVVAFVQLQKKHFLSLTQPEEFQQFFHSPRPLEVKKLIRKTYYIMSNTSARNHPRQYLDMFSSLSSGIMYPTFEEYPKEVVNFQVEHVNHLEGQLKETKQLRESVLKERARQSYYADVDVKNEEERRMIEVEKACMQKIKTYQQNLASQQDELQNLRKELFDQEHEIVRNTKKKLRFRENRENAKTMELLADGLDISEKINEIDIKNLEEAYNLERLGLSRRGPAVHEEDAIGETLNPNFTSQLSCAHQKTLNLKNQIRKARIGLESPKKADIAFTISAMNDLIKKVQSELEKDRFSTSCDSVKEKFKVVELEKETKQLQKEISQLIRMLTEKRGTEECSSTCSSRVFECKRGACPNKTVRFN